MSSTFDKELDAYNYTPLEHAGEQWSDTAHLEDMYENKSFDLILYKCFTKVKLCHG